MSHSSYHPTILPTHHRGFTLIEMMIVITIILTLLGLIFFPYSYYMQRAYVESSGDIIGQGWILAHKDIRNGKLFDTDTTANKILIFRRDSHEIEQYLLSGSTIPDITTFSIDARVKKQNSIIFDSEIILRGFSGAGVESEDTLGYMIEAPYGKGRFFTGSLVPFSSTGVFVTIGYADADTTSGRARQILLRPYLQ